MQIVLRLFCFLILVSLAPRIKQGKIEVEKTSTPLKMSRRLVSTKRTRSSQRRRHWKLLITRNTKASIKRKCSAKAKMEEISAQQKCIKDGQREVRKKFEEIESEYEQLKKETNFIMQHNASTQLRLDLLLKILKAREDGDFAAATNLTQYLRELILSQNKKKQELIDY